MPATQHPMYLGDFVVRYTGDFSSVSSAVRQTIHEIDHTLPITDVTTLDEWVARSITDQRVVAQLSTFFGLLAIFLSAIGIYGLMSYVVSRRTNEIGIRMALGAERMHVRWLVMREVLVLVAIGIAIGIPAALAFEQAGGQHALRPECNRRRQSACRRRRHARHRRARRISAGTPRIEDRSDGCLALRVKRADI